MRAPNVAVRKLATVPKGSIFGCHWVDDDSRAELGASIFGGAGLDLYRKMMILIGEGFLQ